MHKLVNRSLERASIWFKEQQRRLEGVVSQWDRTGVVIRFPTNVPLQTLPAVGTPVTLTLYTHRGLQQAEALVSLWREGECHCSFEPETIQEAGRRRRARYPCHLRVEFRPLDPESPNATWFQTTAIDVGTGGMRFIVGPDVPIPGCLEVRFTLVGAQNPVHATARVAHCRARSDGTTVVGVAFTDLAYFDRACLEQLVR